jgi:SAM-dependent methyltransferase
VRGWVGLYRTSVALGLRHLLRRGYSREAVVRVVIPLDPSRYLELPWAMQALAPATGSRVLDLGSPKLLAVALARGGAHVTTVDEHEGEIASWRALTDREANLELVVADGRALPFADESFDHATSISVLEHVAGDDGDARALAELARCVRPGGRVVLTLPYAAEARTEFRQTPAYADHGVRDEAGRSFFQRWYDAASVERLVRAVPPLELASCTVARMAPNWSAAYNRSFPWLVPLGPLYGLLGRERIGPGGDVVRLQLVRR